MKTRATELSPSAFRREIILDQGGHPFQSLIQNWQDDDFDALDPAWLTLAGYTQDVKYRRAFIERPRGHAKTSDMAVQIAWILAYSQRCVRGIAAAADREQANLIRNAVQRLHRLNPALCKHLEFRQHAVLNPQTHSRLDIISSDVQSSFGMLPDFVICDELCHWEKPDLWHSLFSSAAKRKNCVLVILTNAGVGNDWQWEIREEARKSDRWYFSSIKGPQAPWITSDWLREQQKLLPIPVFERLWHNVWQHSDGEFVTLHEAEACRAPNRTIQKHGHPHRHYIAAVDFAEKHDYTVGVLIHPEGQTLVVDRMDVVVPRPGKPVQIKWVEDWIRDIVKKFHSVTFILDVHQLLGTLQQLESQYDIRRFEFSAGKGNHALALTLRRIIVHQQVVWYPNCGSIQSDRGRDDLETELASLILKQRPNGRCRIDHKQDNIHHDDRAFALGAACLHALKEDTGPEWMQTTDPAPDGGFSHLHAIE